MAGSAVYGIGMHRGIEIGVQRGIEIGLAMAAEATRQNRLRIADTMAQIFGHATPVVMRAVRVHREAKASSRTAA